MSVIVSAKSQYAERTMIGILLYVLVCVIKSVGLISKKTVPV